MQATVFARYCANQFRFSGSIFAAEGNILVAGLFPDAQTVIDVRRQDMQDEIWDSAIAAIPDSDPTIDI
jgi:hypothetical protein